MNEVRDVQTFNDYLKNIKYVGFQATELGRAAEIIKEAKKNNAVFFLSFTANMVASGIRGMIKKLMEMGLGKVVITTGGAIDHDVIKSFMPYTISSFYENDKALHQHSSNRIGNIIVKNDRYELLERISNEVFKKAIKKYGNIVSPSQLAYEYGCYIKEHGNAKDSFLAYACSNNISIFSPGIIDAAIGLNLFFFRQQHKLIIDPGADLKKLGNIVLEAEKTAGIVLGGGIAKHHLIASNIIRDGLDYAVYITTASPFDGSLSGAESREAISWGKIKEESKHITIRSDVTLALPLLIKLIEKKV